MNQTNQTFEAIAEVFEMLPIDPMTLIMLMIGFAMGWIMWRVLFSPRPDYINDIEKRHGSFTYFMPNDGELTHKTETPTDLKRNSAYKIDERDFN